MYLYEIWPRKHQSLQGKGHALPWLAQANSYLALELEMASFSPDSDKGKLDYPNRVGVWLEKTIGGGSGRAQSWRGDFSASYMAFLKNLPADGRPQPRLLTRCISQSSSKPVPRSLQSSHSMGPVKKCQSPRTFCFLNPACHFHICTLWLWHSLTLWCPLHTSLPTKISFFSKLSFSVTF